MNDSYDASVSGQDPPPRNHRKPILTIAAVCGGALAVGIGASALLGGGPHTFRAHGIEELCSYSAGDGTGSSSADFPDVTSGGQVTVTNSQGQVLGTGTLASAPSAGLAESDYSWSTMLPAGLARYGVAIGHDRGIVWFTQKEMASGAGTSLGC